MKDDQKLEKEKRERVENEGVPLYRSYGVTKKVNLTMRAIRDTVAKIVTVVFLVIEFFLILIPTYMLAVYTDVLIATVLFLILFSIFFFNVTKLPRRRLKFWRKLKKACKKNGYELEVKRGFFKSLSWNKEGIDFKLKAGKWTYYVKFATTKRFLSSFTFVSKNEMKYSKIKRNSRFSVIMDFGIKPKSFSIKFPSDIDDNDKYSVKAILINPAVSSVEKKGSDGVVVPTGSGEKIFGYTVFTGTGLLESVKRNIEEEK